MIRRGTRADKDSVPRPGKDGGLRHQGGAVSVDVEEPAVAFLLPLGSLYVITYDLVRLRDCFEDVIPRGYLLIRCDSFRIFRAYTCVLEGVVF